MLDRNIQEALQKLDNNTKKRKKHKFLGKVVMGIAFSCTLVAGTWFFDQANTPSVSMDHLSRLIILASRTSDDDPIRLLGDVERHLGKKMQALSEAERINALAYLMNHIELHHNRQEFISY